MMKYSFIMITSELETKTFAQVNIILQKQKIKGHTITTWKNKNP